MTEQETMDWWERWQGRKARLAGDGMATLYCRADGTVYAEARWTGRYSSLHGDCGKPGKAAERAWWSFVRYASAHPKPQGLGKGRSSPAPRGRIRQRG